MVLPLHVFNIDKEFENLDSYIDTYGDEKERINKSLKAREEQNIIN